MKHVTTILLITLLSLAAGCNSSDPRLARYAEQSTQQQAQQNQSMASLAQSAGDNHRRSVEVVEKSRQEVVTLAQEVRRQADTVDAERRLLANERHRESLLAPVIETLGMLLIAALPLAICVYLLHGLRGHNDEEAVTEVVIRELASRPELLLADVRPRIERRTENMDSPPEDETELPF